MKSKIRENLLSNAPLSELNKHKIGRTVVNARPVNNESRLLAISLITSIICSPNGKIAPYVKNAVDIQKIYNLDDDSINYYNEKVLIDDKSAIQLCEKTVSQSGNVWIRERKKRITGSICYGLFTYVKNKNPNWERKLHCVINKQYSTKATIYGIENEPKAYTYEKITGFRVKKLGFIALPQLPWAGYSADGIVGEKLLLEVKCPILGSAKNIHEVVNQLSYIDSKQDNIKLKKKHSYYGQIQWGLALLNLDVCDFVIYSSFDDSCIILKVLYDKEFVENIMTTLKFVYFTKMLPFISAKLK